jgi:hypothetical protein
MQLRYLVWKNRRGNRRITSDDLVCRSGFFIIWTGNFYIKVGHPSSHFVTHQLRRRKESKPGSWIYVLLKTCPQLRTLCLLCVNVKKTACAINAVQKSRCMVLNVLYTVGCSDFDFFTFWGITTHPWHPKGPWTLANLHYLCAYLPAYLPVITRLFHAGLNTQGFGNWQKNFQLHPWPGEIFGKNRKMCFFGLNSKFNFGAPFDRSLPFFQHVLFLGSLTHIPNFRSLIQKL